MPTETSQLPLLARLKHEEGLGLLKKRRLAEALRSFGEALAHEEDCERWNDWAAAEFLSGQFAEAEQGFRFALELDPDHRQAAENLGFLLVERRRLKEAIPFLTRALNGDGGNVAVAAMLEECRRQLVQWSREFDARLAEDPTPVEKIPRWPLKQYALRLAQLGQLDAALEMVAFNRHFHPTDLELIKMQACIELLHQNGEPQTRSSRSSDAAASNGHGCGF